ncbi:retrovirus-related pol polyprotein from transposon TNT 1-94 [Tanacetum coccineum]
MSQDVILTVMNSMSLYGESVNMERKRIESCDKCFNRDAELLKSQNAHNDLLKSYSQLEKHCISIELSIQLNQEIFQKDESCDNQNAFEILEYFENNDLKAQLQDKDTTICKLKEIIKSTREKSTEENVNYDYCKIETKNVFKEKFDSIKKTRVRTKEQSDSLIEKLNLKSVENEDLKTQIQDKVFVITSLKNDLRKLKGKEIIDIAAQIPYANTIIPGMFKLDLEPLYPRLLQNREAHIDYLKYTQEQANILQGIVEQAKAKQPFDSALDFACKHAQRIQELLVYVRDTCLNAIKLNAKKVAVTPKNNVQKVRFTEPLTSSSNIKQVESSKTSDSNTPVLYPIRLKCSTNVKHSLLNVNSICATCKKSMFDGVHDMCLLDFVKSIVRFGNDNIVRIMGYGDYQLACALEKSMKSSHQPKAEDTNQEKLYLLHMDMMWLLTFSRSKDEAPEAIIKCIKIIQVCLNDPVHNVRTDNGTEFVNQTLHEFYENVGISHQTSLSRTPQQNSIVKRRNQTLVEAARIMLIFSKAPLFFWAEAINTSGYTQNHSLIRLGYNKTPYEIMLDKKLDLSFFHVFGALCYPTNDNDDLGKIDAKADIGNFVGYTPAKKAFRIYNKRTQKIIETIHVTFNETTTMAFEQFSSGPGLHYMTPGTSSSGLVSNPVSQQPCIPPNRDDWDHLFQPMFDEYFNPPSIAISPVQEAAALRAVVLADSHVSTSINQDAPSTNSTSQGSSSNVRQTHTPFKHLGKWTKNHPIANVIGDPSHSVSTKKLLQTDAMWCYFDAFLTSVEPKNFKQAMTEPRHKRAFKIKHVTALADLRVKTWYAGSRIADLASGGGGVYCKQGSENEGSATGIGARSRRVGQDGWVLVIDAIASAQVEQLELLAVACRIVRSCATSVFCGREVVNAGGPLVGDLNADQRAKGGWLFGRACGARFLKVSGYLSRGGARGLGQGLCLTYLILIVIQEFKSLEPIEDPGLVRSVPHLYTSKYVESSVDDVVDQHLALFITVRVDKWLESTPLPGISTKIGTSVNVPGGVLSTAMYRFQSDGVSGSLFSGHFIVFLRRFVPNSAVHVGGCASSELRGVGGTEQGSAGS